MNAVIQFDLFAPIPTPEEMMRMDLDAGLKTLEKMRKSLYARNGVLEKRMLQTELRMEILEAHICQKK